jgi:hypothetical protein
MIDRQSQNEAFRRDIACSTDKPWLRRQLSVEFVEPKAVRFAGWCVKQFTLGMLGAAIVLICAATFPGWR